MKKNTLSACSGCMACKKVCPKNCISIKENGKGFVRDIDGSVCIGCKKCEKVCHIMHQNLRHPVKAYVAKSKNPSVQRNSASGGIAAAIYEYCLDHKICCVGVRYNSKMQAYYDFIKNKEEIRKFSGSKYVYSHMEDIYAEVLERIQKDKKVVFIGLPCHVMAMRNYLGNDCKNILYIDIVCHGVCSEKILKEHLVNVCGDKINRISNVLFRELNNQYGITVRDKNNKLIVKKDRYNDEYMIGYCNEITYLEECYHCKYARPDRSGDLTIKDHAGEIIKEFQGDRNGLSDILVNTKKGKDFLGLMEEYIYMERYPVQKVLLQDERLRFPTPYKLRRRLYNLLRTRLGFERTINILFCLKIWKGK